MDIQGQIGELRMVVQVTRAETGKVEEYVLTSTVTKEQAEALGIDTESKEDSCQ